jgi:general secretion pathway protein J
MTSRSRGFTLIEVLIAVTIFAVMSAFAYRALTSILNARERVAQETQKWRGVATFFARLEADLTNAVGRDIRNSNDLTESALIGNLTFNKETEGQLMFTRMGLPGASGSLAAPQRLGYRVKQGTIEELVWPVLDQGQRTAPAVYPLLSGVNSLKLRYFNASNAWQDTWPVVNFGASAGAAAPKLPRAIEVVLTLDSGEAITRILLLPS